MPWWKNITNLLSSILHLTFPPNESCSFKMKQCQSDFGCLIFDLLHIQYTSIYLTQLSIFSALTLPSYIGKTNFTSSLSNGISGLCLWEWECFLAELGFELVLEEEEEDGDEGGEGGGFGGSSPSSLLSCFEDYPWKGLFHSK